ncbi:hypothetical protein [Streptomyces antibioticus]|uniref:hypothetical protein n=1 Tax=Streptomyces antibioticus TaxID=1890 RepID=UPI0033AD7F52
MPAACPTVSSAPVITPATERLERVGHEPPILAELLDLQESEVPGTADALQHFFPEA